MKNTLFLVLSSIILVACGGGESSSNTSTQPPIESTPTADTTAPLITLTGENTVIITEGDVFNDPGASAVDDTDGTVAVTVSGVVGSSPGEYQLIYNASDSAGNSSSASRLILVEALEEIPIDPPVQNEFGLVLKNGAIGSSWDKGILAFDSALNYADCVMSGGTTCMSINWSFVTDPERGSALKVVHPENADHAGVFIASSDGVDLTSVENGTLTFDIKILSGDGLITTKLDCFYPCSSGDQLLVALDLNVWHTVRLSVASLVQKGLKLNKVNTGIVIWASNHNGSTFLIDDIRFTASIEDELTTILDGNVEPNVPVSQNYELTQLGAGSYSDTINTASYRCVYDYGNWIYNAGIVEPGIADCNTDTGTPMGAPTPLQPQRTASLVNRPLPTHKWWGSLSFMGEMTVGDVNDAAYITPDPLIARLTNKGFRAMGIPNGLRVSGTNFGYTIPDPFAEVFDGIAIAHSSGVDMQAYLKDYSDGSVTVQWQAGEAAKLEATFIHGSPYVFVTVFDGDLIIKTLRADSTEKGTFTSPTGTLGLWTELAGNHNNFLISGTSDTEFSNVEGNTITASNSSGLFTLAYIPETNGLPSTNLVNAIAAQSQKRVAKLLIDYVVDRSNNQITVTHHYLDANSQPIDTLMGLQPLHWKRSYTVAPVTQVRSARGMTKFVLGHEFSYTLDSIGVLPALPNVASTLSISQLNTLVDNLLEQGESSWKPYNDAYWSGKIYGKVAELIAITQQAGLMTEHERLLSWLKTELADWLTAGSSDALDVKQYFAYDKQWSALLAMEESFGSHQQLNDHHFHYGYMVRAAAEICRNEPTWCSSDQYGPMVELLIRDYAAGRDDPMFPYLRHFDPANGFSWASGKANFVRGNNNESTSEAANAYGAMVLYGLITGNDEIMERGMYLHASTAATFWEYWNNLDGFRNVGAEHDNFPPGYGYLSTSIVWGDGAAFSTWFSAAYAHILGIQGLPSNTLNMHVGLNSDYMQSYVALGLAESSNGKPSGLAADQWRDIWWNLMAMVDPETALTDYQSVTSYTPEAGESKAHTYHWLHNMQALGHIVSGKGLVTADYPSAMVFDKNGARSYVAYNFGTAPRTISFSDGVSMTAAAGQFSVHRP